MNPGQKPEERERLVSLAREHGLCRHGYGRGCAVCSVQTREEKDAAIRKYGGGQGLNGELRRLGALSTQPEEGPREEDSWCCDSCGAISPIEQAEEAGWEQEGPDDANVTVERCPACRLRPGCGGTKEIPNPGAPAWDPRCPCPGCPDCQEAGEGLAERLRSLAAEEARRYEEGGLPNDLAHYLGAQGAYENAVELVIENTQSLSDPDLQGRVEELEVALRPFAGCGTTEDGSPTSEEWWPPARDRILDWFGPSDFAAARAALNNHTEEKRDA